jgi:hypothetical protein
MLLRTQVRSTSTIPVRLLTGFLLLTAPKRRKGAKKDAPTPLSAQKSKSLVEAEPDIVEFEGNEGALDHLPTVNESDEEANLQDDSYHPDDEIEPVVRTPSPTNCMYCPMQHTITLTHYHLAHDPDEEPNQKGRVSAPPQLSPTLKKRVISRPPSVRSLCSLY